MLAVMKMREIHMGQSLTSVIFRHSKTPDTSDQFGNSEGTTTTPMRCPRRFPREIRLWANEKRTATRRPRATVIRKRFNKGKMGTRGREGGARHDVGRIIWTPEHQDHLVFAHIIFLTGDEGPDRTGARRARPGCAPRARGRFELHATEASDWSPEMGDVFLCTAPALAYRQGREAQHNTPQQSQQHRGLHNLGPMDKNIPSSYYYLQYVGHHTRASTSTTWCGQSPLHHVLGRACRRGMRDTYLP